MAIVNVLNMLNFKQFKIMTSGNLIIWYNKAVTLYMVTIFFILFRSILVFVINFWQHSVLMMITGPLAQDH